MLNLISERLRTTSVKPSRRRPLFAYTWRDLGESSRLHCGVLRKLSVTARVRAAAARMRTWSISRYRARPTPRRCGQRRRGSWGGSASTRVL